MRHGKGSGRRNVYRRSPEGDEIFVMARFSYSAFSQAGQVVHGAIEAASQTEALNLIHEKGLRPFQAIEALNQDKKKKLFSFGSGGGLGKSVDLGGRRI